MTENKLKTMIDNHELDNLMTNSGKLEKLKNSETTDQVLEILNDYKYTETKEVFERELLEILQSIKLPEEEMRNVSGGKLTKTKNLSMMLGGLMAINSAGFLPVGAVNEQQKNTAKYSGKSLLNKADMSDALKIGGGAAGIGLLWALKEIVTSRRDNTTFKLSSIQQKIYSDTKKLSDMILKYVGKYINAYSTMPEDELKIVDPYHREILELIETIRNDWLNVYDNTTEKKLNPEKKQNVMKNKEEDVGDRKVFLVRIDEDAVENLFYGLPVGNTWMTVKCLPFCPKDCNDKKMAFLGLLWKLETQFRSNFLNLTKNVTNPNENAESLSDD